MSIDQPTTVSLDPDEPRIGLCLSGGGFRAALYGLGVVRYLAEAGLLRHVQVVSAVSGGSAAAAVLADRWPGLTAAGLSEASFVREIDEPFHLAITTKNMRNAAVARWAGRRLTLRGRSRGSAMGDVLVRELLSVERVIELDPALQIVITSTDLATGRAFRVSRDFIGSYDYGYHDVPADLSLGHAVAASAAVPLLFPPQYLRTKGLGLEAAPRLLSLVDGGVYDNLGLEWFQGWASGRPSTARPADFVLVVDASRPLKNNPRAFAGIRAINRTREIQYTQTRASRTRWFVDALIAGRLGGAFLQAKSDPCGFALPDGTPIARELYVGALPAGFASALTNLRTDLDRFTSIEASLLRYHGYWSAHARLAALFPGLALARTPSWTEYAGLTTAESERLINELRFGARRRLRR